MAIDGSKFKANNSRDRNFNRKTLAKKLEEMERRIDDYMKELDGNDADESSRHTADELRARLERLESKKYEYTQILKSLEKSGEQQISMTDPESRLMKTRQGYDVCYNVQTAVEAENHFVVNFDATNDANDMRQLESTVNGAKEALGADCIEAIADKGYRSDSEVLRCLLNGDTPNVYCNDKRKCYQFEFKQTEVYISPEMTASREPETLIACIEAGVMPDVLRDKNVTIDVVIPETLHEGQEIFERQPPLFEDFERDLQTNKVRCPMGQTLSHWGYTSNKARNSKYGNAKACTACINKCTAGSFRRIAFKPGVTNIRATFYDRCLSGDPILRFQLPRAVTTKIPEKSKVILRFYPDYKKLALRSQTVEHPFGTVKHWGGASFLLLKGKQKVTSELSLAFLGYNMKRAIKLLGASALVEMLRIGKVVMA